MINDGAKVLVIASIDGTALGPVLQTAADAGIKVIAYDRLINDTANVDYYATFDNYKVGQLQGEFIRDALDLEGDGGPYNFEPFAGSPDDNNAKFFFSGAGTSSTSTSRAASSSCSRARPRPRTTTGRASASSAGARTTPRPRWRTA